MKEEITMSLFLHKEDGSARWVCDITNTKQKINDMVRDLNISTPERIRFSVDPVDTDN